MLDVLEGTASAWIASLSGDGLLLAAHTLQRIEWPLWVRDDQLRLAFSQHWCGFLFDIPRYGP